MSLTPKTTWQPRERQIRKWGLAVAQFSLLGPQFPKQVSIGVEGKRLSFELDGTSFQNVVQTAYAKPAVPIGFQHDAMFAVCIGLTVFSR